MHEQLKGQSSSVTPKIISLTFGDKIMLVSPLSNSNTSWRSDNPKIVVDQQQYANLAIDQFNNQTYLSGTIYLVEKNNKVLDSVKITGVPWKSNLSNLYITGNYKEYAILGNKGDSIIFSSKSKLFYSSNNLNKPKEISLFHADNLYASYLTTPFGDFIRDGAKIYESANMKDWVLRFETRYGGLVHSFVYKLNDKQDTCFLFTHDYTPTGQDTIPGTVYRGIYTKDNGSWDKPFTLYSMVDHTRDLSLYPYCRHIHTVAIDPYTGHIWIGTGDDSFGSHLFYSPDNGKTFQHIGFGSQDWRTLSIWFTKEAIFWAMDAVAPNQKVWSIKRTVFNKKGVWPDMTPLIQSGFTKVGLRYLIHNNTGNVLPGKPGQDYTETKARPLSNNNNAFVINDPELSYKEAVIDLTNSALWSHLEIHDEKGDLLYLLCTDAEGQIRDSNSRIFGIKERVDGTLDVQELFVHNGKSPYTQFYPKVQDNDQNIYFKGVNSDMTDTYQMHLNWSDNSKSNGGLVTVDSLHKSGSNLYKLTLSSYDGKVIKWQKGDRNYNWTDIDSKSDTMSVPLKTDVVYYRAIVQKEGSSPVSSYPAKIVISDVYTGITKANKPLDPFIIGPNPAKDMLIIRGNNIEDNILYLDIYNFDGKCLIKKILYQSSPSIYETVNVSNLRKGAYILRLKGLKNSSVKKILIE
jgi:hypothetical protein